MTEVQALADKTLTSFDGALVGIGSKKSYADARRVARANNTSSSGSDPAMKQIIVGMTGATGAVFGVELLPQLQQCPDVRTHLVLSRWARTTIQLCPPEPRSPELVNVAQRLPQHAPAPSCWPRREFWTACAPRRPSGWHRSSVTQRWNSTKTEWSSPWTPSPPQVRPLDGGPGPHA